MHLAKACRAAFSELNAEMNKQSRSEFPLIVLALLTSQVLEHMSIYSTREQLYVRKSRHPLSEPNVHMPLRTAPKSTSHTCAVYGMPLPRAGLGRLPDPKRLHLYTPANILLRIAPTAKLMNLKNAVPYMVTVDGHQVKRLDESEIRTSGAEIVIDLTRRQR